MRNSGHRSGWSPLLPPNSTPAEEERKGKSSTTRKRIDDNADCTTTVTILEVTYQDIFRSYPGVITGCFNTTSRYSTCF